MEVIHTKNAYYLSTFITKYEEFGEWVSKKIEGYSSAYYHDYPAIHEKKSEQMYQVQMYSGEIYSKSHYCGKIKEGYYLPDGIYTIRFMKDSIRIYNPIGSIKKYNERTPIVRYSQSDSLAMFHAIRNMREKYTTITFPLPTEETTNVITIGAFWWHETEIAHIVAMCHGKKYIFRLAHCPSRDYAMMVGIIKVFQYNLSKNIELHVTFSRFNKSEDYSYLSREWLLKFEENETHGKYHDTAKDMLSWFAHAENKIQLKIVYHKSHHEPFFKEVYKSIQEIDMPLAASYKSSPLYIV